jgi:preprotein translocase subunit Sec63
MGLVLHWYSASVELERLIISDTQKVQLSELTVDFLPHLQEDVLYTFVNHQKGWIG